MNRVLVVDDDQAILRLISTMLRENGFQTHEAEDGRQALKALEENRTDLCIVDVMMPHMDGFAFCEKAKALYEVMPILLLTAKQEIWAKREGFQAGADDD